MTDQKIQEYVKKLQRGDMSAFDELYEATKTHVYYTILVILKDESSTEDIMQDTYLKMLESIEKYKPKRPFKAWIGTIARNLAINAYHKKKREVGMPDDAENFLLPTHESSSENAYYLHGLMKALNDEEKEVIVRYVILEEKHKDIAKKMQKPLGTITWMYQNALKKLRKEAGEDHE